VSLPSFWGTAASPRPGSTWKLRTPIAATNSLLAKCSTCLMMGSPGRPSEPGSVIGELKWLAAAPKVAISSLDMKACRAREQLVRRASTPLRSADGMAHLREVCEQEVKDQADYDRSLVQQDTGESVPTTQGLFPAARRTCEWHSRTTFFFLGSIRAPLSRR